MDNYQNRMFRCLRCGFIWRQGVQDEKPNIKSCPKCGSLEWNKSKSVPKKA